MGNVSNETALDSVAYPNLTMLKAHSPEAGQSHPIRAPWEALIVFRSLLNTVLSTGHFVHRSGCQNTRSRIHWQDVAAHPDDHRVSQLSKGCSHIALVQERSKFVA